MKLTDCVKTGVPEELENELKQLKLNGNEKKSLFE